uniref:Uncharacterized protein n=1 Tax=Brassica oleracea TaxID=3712 RepID=A0A3P6EDS0_BRAOL|nr:unnamed protein product [Brassica oleracea]
MCPSAQSRTRFFHQPQVIPRVKLIRRLWIDPWSLLRSSSVTLLERRETKTNSKNTHLVILIRTKVKITLADSSLM